MLVDRRELPSKETRLPAEDGQRHAGIPARILLVDDDDRERAMNAALLRGETNQIEFAASGREALDFARHWNPDLVLLDIMMPEVDGYEVCRQLRSDPATAELRVFMLTSLDDAASRLRAFEAGADDFLTKPLHRAETWARIQSIARLNRYRAIIRYHQELARARVEPEIRDLSLEEVAGRLHSAIDQLSMWFQPIVRVTEDGTSPYAHEALMRSPTRPFDNPLTLLTAASSLGELSRLSAAIRRGVAAAAEKLDGRLFMNLTVTELLDEEFFLPDNPLLGLSERIVLEITEREPVSNVSDFTRRIRRLRELGFRIAVDDLGGGFSSLQSMVAVEPEIAKVDRSLIDGLDAEPKKQKIVGSIAGLCRELGIELIVEGVETAAERATLLGLGCTIMQGFYFGRPRALSES